MQIAPADYFTLAASFDLPFTVQRAKTRSVTLGWSAARGRGSIEHWRQERVD